jgi:hypothetical protein
MRTNHHSSMFHLASKLLKYYFLGLFGFTVICLASVIIGAFPMIQPLLPSLSEWLVRLAAFTLCFLATAIIVESLRV